MIKIFSGTRTAITGTAKRPCRPIRARRPAATVGCWLACALIVALLSTAGPVWAASGAMQVTRIIQGQASVRSTDLRIIPPGSKTARNMKLRVGAQIQNGTEIDVPAGTRISLTSSNGNVLETQGGQTRLKVIGVSTKGEKFEVLMGKVGAFVNNKLSFWSIGHGQQTAAATSTQYIVGVDSKDELTVHVSEGVVEVQRPAKVKVAGKEYGGYKTHEKVEAGQTLSQAQQVSPYRTFEDAVAYFEMQRRIAVDNGDQWGAASWNYNLATLKSDAATTRAEARAAAQLFREGYEHVPLVETDQYWAVVYLVGYGDAMFNAGDYTQARDGHLFALETLMESDPTLESFMATIIKFSLGHDFLKTNEADRAKLAFQDALEVFYDGFEGDYGDEEALELGGIWFSLGVANHRLGEWEDAEFAFGAARETFVALAPGAGIVEEIDRRMRAVNTRQRGGHDDDDYLDFAAFE